MERNWKAAYVKVDPLALLNISKVLVIIEFIICKAFRFVTMPLKVKRKEKQTPIFNISFISYIQIQRNID